MNTTKRFVSRKKYNSLEYLFKPRSALINQNPELLNYIQFFKSFPEYLKNLIVLKDSKQGYKPCGYIFQDGLTGITHYSILEGSPFKSNIEKELLKLHEPFSNKRASSEV